MQEIGNCEKIKVTGGAINFGITAMIGAAISFVVGIVDGLINPDKCKS